jgi:hypothetical protein
VSEYELDSAYPVYLIIVFLEGAQIFEKLKDYQLLEKNIWLGLDY